MKKKFLFRNLLLNCAEVCVLVGITLIAVVPFSCKVSTQGVQILDGDYVAPQLESFSVIDSRTVEMIFSEQVIVSGTVVSPYVENVTDSDEHSATENLSMALSAASGEDGAISSQVVYDENDSSIVRVVLEHDADVGKKYELYGVVEDLHGNSLTFTFTFVGFNSRIPNLVMTEIQTDLVSKNTEEKTNGTRRAEFVEFLALSDGNLAGLEICSAYSGESKNYIFPAVEVSKGEIIVVHMRNTGEGCISEEGDSLNLASGAYTNESVRDLWSDNDSKCFGSKTDIIVLKNTLTNVIVDAVMFRESAVLSWDGMKVDYSSEVAAAGIYEGAEIEYATIADNKTAALTLSRVDALELYEKVLGSNSDSVIERKTSNPETWIANSKASAGVIQ